MEQQERTGVEEYEAPLMVEAGDFREVTLGGAVGFIEDEGRFNH